MNEHLNHFHFPCQHHETTVEQPQPKFSAPMLIVKNNELVVEQKV